VKRILITEQTAPAIMAVITIFIVVSNPRKKATTENNFTSPPPNAPMTKSG
jgi:hypothetical protein